MSSQFLKSLDSLKTLVCPRGDLFTEDFSFWVTCAYVYEHWDEIMNSEVKEDAKPAEQ